MNLHQDRAEPEPNRRLAPPHDRPETARPPVDVDAQAEETLAADVGDIDALLPVAFESGAARVVMGQDLVDLLRAAEERLDGRGEVESRPGELDEDVADVPVPSDVLALLAEPLENEEEDAGTGVAQGSSVVGTGADRPATLDGPMATAPGPEDDLEQPLPRKASSVPRDLAPDAARQAASPDIGRAPLAASVRSEIGRRESGPSSVAPREDGSAARASEPYLESARTGAGSVPPDHVTSIGQRSSSMPPGRSVTSETPSPRDALSPRETPMDRGASLRRPERIFEGRNVADRSANERVFSDRNAEGRVPQERVFDGRSVADRSANERVFSDRNVADRGANERVFSDRNVADRSANERVFSDRNVADRGANERVFSDRNVEGRVPQERVFDGRNVLDRGGAGERDGTGERGLGERGSSSDRAFLERSLAAERAAMAERPATGRIVERPAHGGDGSRWHTMKMVSPAATDSGEIARSRVAVARTEASPAVLGPGDAPKALGRAIASRVSGALLLTSGDDQRRVVLHDGDVVTAGSSAPVESLVAFLAARGDLDRDLVPRLTGKMPAFGRHAGAALVANGYLGQDDLWPVLRAHAEWVMGRAILVASGTCELEAEPPARYKAEPSVFGGATGAEVFIDTIQRVIAPDAALARLGGYGARIAPGPRPGMLAECALTPEEEEAMRAAPGHTVHQFTGDGPSERWSLLFGLVCLEVLDVLPAAAVSQAKAPPLPDPLDDEAIRARVRARLSLVEEGDYFALLGVPRSATSYEIRRAYLELRRTFEPSRILTAATADLVDDVRLVIEVLEEAYEILRDAPRRDRYRRAIEAGPPR